MATQNIPVLHKGTETPGKVPTAADVMERQLVLNLADGLLYSKTSTGAIVKFGVSPGDLSTVAFSGSYDDLQNKPTIPPPYTLVPATASVLGGVMVGDGLNVTLGGLISAKVLSVQGQDGSPQIGAVIITRADLGLDILDSNNRIKPEYLPDSITGAMVYKGTWDASTNTPAIPAAEAANLGWLYVVAVAGSTDIDGNTTWNVGDWLVSDGTKWQRVPALVAAVVSVNGQTGAVVINATNLPGLAAVAKDGQYSSLLGIPTEFPPAAHTQPASSITGLATVATSGSYNDLTDLPPDPSISLVGFNAIGAPVLQGNVRYPFAKQVRFQQNWAGSAAYFSLFTGNTATVQLNRIRGGVSTPVGTIQYTQSSGLVVFTSTETTPTFLANDILEWVWPSNIGQFSCNMNGIRFA